MIAGHLKLDNLVVIVDNNNIQGSGYVDKIMRGRSSDRCANSGWTVTEMNGHDDDAWEQFENCRWLYDQPQLPSSDRGTYDQGSWCIIYGEPTQVHSNWLGGEMLEKARQELT